MSRISQFFTKDLQQKQKQTVGVFELQTSNRPLLNIIISAAQWQNPIFPGTPPVCVPDVLAALAVWRLETKKKSSKHIFFLDVATAHCSPNTSPEVVHRPRSQTHLHFDIRNI